MGFILLFIIAIFIKPPLKLFAWLFFTALISEFLYHFLSGIRDTRKIKSKHQPFKNLQTGFYKIIDIKTNTELGKLSNENIDFLRKRFLEQNMDDNDFYFLPETLKMFLKEEKPNKELTQFLNIAIKEKNEIELHWESI
jgi:hypothetical protein